MSGFFIKKSVLLDYNGIDENVVIPDTVTVIGDSAFYDRTDITSVIIPDSVTVIDDSAFEGCTNLTSVTIPDSVTVIGDWAFKGCTNLTSVTISDSVASIGNRAFEDCSNLTSVTIPDSVTVIGDWAFSKCKSLKSIIIPDSVMEIGEMAFYQCENLISVNVPYSPTVIGDMSFYKCENLRYVNFPFLYEKSSSRFLSEHKKSRSLYVNSTYLNIETVIGLRHYKSIIAPYSDFSKYTYKLPFAIGFLSEPEKFTDEKIIKTYSDYLKTPTPSILKYIFESDNAKAVYTLININCITRENYEKDFFEPAFRLKAKECVAVLLDWKNKNSDSEKDVFSELEL